MANKYKMPLFDLVREFKQDPDRKPVNRMVAEILTLFFINWRFPRHYFSRFLFKKGTHNIRDYYSDNFLYYKLKPFYNENEIRDVLENKLFFNFYFGPLGVPLPKIIMYNHKNVFVIEGISQIVNTPEDMAVLIQKQFCRDESYDSLIIKKTYWSYGGSGIFKIMRKQFMEDPSVSDQLFSDIISSGSLFQETIIQHPELNILNPSCVNTARIDTFIDENGKVEIISAYLRMSTKDICVDNISSGGCRVGIDLETGRLKRDGFYNFRSNGVKVLTKHPLTNTTFENFKLPFFTEAKEIVIKAAGLMPGLRLVGWDVAFGESGPVLVEGNSDYEISGNDLTYGGYRTNPVFRKVLEELKYS